MWQIAKYYAISTRILHLLRNWYIGISSFVRMDGEEGELLPINTGLKQCCVMSTLLFNIYMDATMRKITEVLAGGVIVGSEVVVDLDFADDVAC